MKNLYIKPAIEEVSVRLKGSILDDPGIGEWSNGTSALGTKKNGEIDFDDEDDSVAPGLGGINLWDD